MLDASSSKAPGPSALPLRSADICNADWHISPKWAKTSVGRPRSDFVHVPGDWGHEGNTPMWSPEPLPVS
jgi:hypothetical protein